MFCTACGQQLVPGAAVCVRCGRPAGIAPVPVLYNRVHRHFQTLWILWLVYAAWSVLQALIVLSILSGPYTHWAWGWHGYGNTMAWPLWGAHVPWVVPFMGIFLGLRVILDVATGIALRQRWHGARVLAIVAAVLTLLKPITGTALAIYTLWVLAPGLSGQEWNQIARPGYPPLQG